MAKALTLEPIEASKSVDDQLLLMRQFLDPVNTLDQEAWESFAAIWEPCSYKRKEIITLAEQPEKYLYFVLEGVQRIYYASDDEKEATLIFTYPHSYGGVLDAFLLQHPARYYYECLTASTLLRAPYSKFAQSLASSRELDALVQKQTHYALSGLLERMVELQCFSAEEKFRTLLQRSPKVLQLVPHKYLANYLGIDPTNFSKFLNSVRI